MRKDSCRFGAGYVYRAGHERCGVILHLDQSFSSGLRQGRALQLSSRGCTLKRSEEHGDV